MPKRFKDFEKQKMYERMLALAQDQTSELYFNGTPRRVPGFHVAFWDGFSGYFRLTGPQKSPHFDNWGLNAACFRAGQDFACSSEGCKLHRDLHNSGNMPDWFVPIRKP